MKDLNYVITGGTDTHLTDVVDKLEHARKKMLMSAEFAIKKLGRWEFRVADVTGPLIKAMDDRCAAPLKPGTIPDPEDLTTDFSKWVNLFIIEVINKICLSSHMGLMEQGKRLLSTDERV